MKKLTMLMSIMAALAIHAAYPPVSIEFDPQPQRVKKAIVPEKTIVAAYIDLGKAYDNGKDVATTIINALPTDEKAEAKRGYEGVIKSIDKVKDALNAEWAVVAFGGEMKSLANSKNLGENIAVVIKVRASEDDVKKWLKKDVGYHEIRTVKGRGCVFFDLGKSCLGLIDEKYIIISDSGDAFNDMFELYRGIGKCSDDFGDLSEISGDTVCRVLTAPISSLIKRFELTKEVEKFGEDSEDKELAEMILNMGAISLDVGVGDKVALDLGISLNSADEAKIIENLMGSAAFLARVGCDAGAYVVKNPELFGTMDVPDDAKFSIAVAGELFTHLAKNIKATRDGNTAMFSIALETKKIADCIEKVSKKSYASYLADARITETRLLIKNIEVACLMYNMKHGKYPIQLSELMVGDDDNPPLLDGGLEDPWGNEIKYERKGKRIYLTSFGPDGKEGTEDDITNLDKKKKYRRYPSAPF